MGKGIVKFAFQEFVANGKLLGSLIMLTIFSMFLQSMQNAFEKSTISKVAYSIVYMVLVIIALNSFHIAISYTNEAIGSMISFVLALDPTFTCINCSFRWTCFSSFFSSSYFIFNEYKWFVYAIYYTASSFLSNLVEYC